jgi:hypothetical protein
MKISTAIKTVGFTAILLFAVTASKTVHAQMPVASAGALADACSHAKNIELPNGKIDGRKTEDLIKVGSCIGFLTGWIEGIDGTTYQESNGAYVMVEVKRDHIMDASFVADALLSFLARNPDQTEKPADDVLRRVLREKRLLNLSLVSMPGAAAR